MGRVEQVINHGEGYVHTQTGVRIRHRVGEVRGVGSGYAPPSCPGDRHDGRCQVLYSAACDVRHRDNGGAPCEATATRCLVHGWRWREGDR